MIILMEQYEGHLPRPKGYKIVPQRSELLPLLQLQQYIKEKFEIFYY